ncbi:MAG: exodeoxyribonuclease VII large subunit [Acidobacteriota bacterium]|jgi:exodeoxyribonuclease VII large subunit|nr:exodeoxyribonuclease VII large subunit [Acidobacteriota bacterium]
MKSPLLQSLFDEQESRPLTISELNEQVKGELEKRFRSVWVEAEIVNFVAANSGHWYFTLHDGDSQLKAACYVRNNLRIRFQPFDGLQVRVRGKLSVYEPKGEYQMLVESLEPVGEGALKVAFEQIKIKLAREGLFSEELKRELPFFPRRIGVVTSPNGAAFHDILNVLSRRTRTVNIVLIPTRVQGETAGEEITKAIESANRFNAGAETDDKIDVLIVGRGGGSSEDLWAFNEERVARAIRLSEIPIISAVGHEIDFTIADFVSDRRAPTPSAAAEIVAESEYQIGAFITQKVQDLFQFIDYKLLRLRSDLQEFALSPVFTEFPLDVKDLRYEVEDFEAQLRDAALDKLKIEKQVLETLTNRLSPLKLASKLNEKKIRLALLEQKQISAIKDVAYKKNERLKIEMASLDALSPLSVLKRGFSIVQTQEGKILRDAEKIKQNERVKIRLSRGRIEAEVKLVEK